MRWLPLLICIIMSLHSDNKYAYYDSLSLEELMQITIDSAGKQKEQISEIPASVIIVTRDEIQKYGYTTVSEVLKNVPGLFHVYNYAQDTFGIRGILGGEIVLLVNGVVQRYTNLLHFSFNAEVVDRIEIVRGPMSVIYGNGAFLGSVNIITNELHDNEETLNMASLGIGTSNTQTAFTRFESVEENLKTVISASFYDTKGVDAEYKDMLSPSQFSQIPDGAHTSTNGDLERNNKYFNLYTEYKKIYLQLQVNETINEWYVLTPSFGEGNEETTTTTVSTIGYKDEISKNISLDAKVTYSTYKELRDYDFIAKELTGERKTSARTIDAELDFIYNPTDELNAIVGINYINTSDLSRNLQVPILGANQLIQSSDVVTRSAFIQLNYKPAKKLKIIAGLRLEQDLRFTNKTTVCEGTSCTAHVEVASPNEKIHKIPRLAFIYSLNQHHIFKFLYGEATRHEFLLSADTDKREMIETYEINYLYVKPNLSLSLSLFHNNINNLSRGFQIFNHDTGEVDSFFDDSGELVTQGIELITRFALNENFLFDISGTYVNVEDTKNNIDPGNAPELLFKARASWHKNDFTSAINATYTSKMKADWNAILEDGSVNRIGDEVDANIILDANIRYEHSSDLYANIHISNILDEEIRYPASNDTPFHKGLIGQERRILLTLGKKF